MSMAPTLSKKAPTTTAQTMSDHPTDDWLERCTMAMAEIHDSDRDRCPAGPLERQVVERILAAAKDRNALEKRFEILLDTSSKWLAAERGASNYDGLSSTIRAQLLAGVENATSD